MLLLAVAAFWGPTAGAQAALPPRPPVVEDYANYPLGLGLIPAGCTTQAPATLTGVQFNIDGGTPFDDLRDMTTPQATAGQTLTMTWTGFAPGCEGIGVGLSRKITPHVFFDLTANQWAQYGAYCGPGGTACAAPFTLSIPLHPIGDVPCYQIDAHLGPLLLDVGPAGGFYTNSQFNMLISAFNGGTEPCGVPPCPTNPDIPAGALACEETTTTQPPAPPTTEPPAVLPTTTPPTTQPVAVIAESVVRPTLVVTGKNEAPMTTAGLLLLVGGTALVAVAVLLRGTGRRRPVGS